MKSKARELRFLLDAVKEIELARLSQISASQDELSRNMAHMRQERSDVHRNAIKTDCLSPADLCGGGAKWDRWVDRELSALSFDLAALAADKEQQKICAQKALGRVSAFEGLLRKRSAQRPQF